MRIQQMKKGSALLVVLGMLSFMVVSAVSFSIFMRENRAPSSYLRRNLAARHLVKAALANAIADLDGQWNDDELWGGGDVNGNKLSQNRFFGIYDDPYPGCGPDEQYANSGSGTGSSVAKDGDYWFRRVFCPFGLIGMNPSDYENQSGGKNKDAASFDALEETVPTMTLEALAYLPPALVDDVRRVSRLSRTACWRNLPYDAGRFAYTAVNVSDLFDINRLRANVPRNSGTDRVTLATLCATDPTDPMQLSSGNASTLDGLIGTPAAEANIPFVSLADFAISARGSSYSPFSRYIGQSAGMFLQDSAQEANAMFITDTWFPPTNTATASVRYDLGGAHQPFREYTANSFLEVLLKVNSQDNVNKVFEKNIGIGLAALYDYLDSDNIPCSFSVPTTEAVPMVVGISSPAGLKPEFGNIGGAESSQVSGLSGSVMTEDGAVAVNDITIDRKCQLKGITSFGGSVVVKTMVAYPFKRMKTTNRAKNYSVRGLMRVWLAPAGMGCRAPYSNNLYPKKDQWQNGLVANGVATFLSDTETLSTFGTKDVKKTDEALDDSILLRFSDLSVQMPVYVNVTEENPKSASQPGKAATPDPSNFKASYLSFAGLRTNDKALRPLIASGNSAGDVDADWKTVVNAAQNDRTFKYPDGMTEFDPTTVLQGQYRFYAAIWVQVMDGSQVVDMVPACLADDNAWLPSANLPDNSTLTDKLGDGAPLLNFQGDEDVTFAKIESMSGKLFQSAATWQTLYAVDPRFNFAPENWFSMNAQATVSKAEWEVALGLNGGSSTVMGQSGRDRDIFMFVSDQEYMQSIGELQFIPALDLMEETGGFLTGYYDPVFNGNTQPFTTRTQANLTGDMSIFACGRWFWKTFTAYQSTSGLDPDPVYALPYNGQEVTFQSGVGSFKLNPYSQDDRVLAAALIGTPFDYYVASTNDAQRVNKNTLIASINLNNMMSTYSFGDADSAKMDADDLMDIMDKIRDAFGDAAQDTKLSWQDAWDDLVWQDLAAGQINEVNMNFLGINLKNVLHGVDRKYLYSFWRECFDNRQQLFLVFVRAEPCAVGGGDSSSVSGQLGGRAVALVWRDPSPPGSGVTRPPRNDLRLSRDQFMEMRKNVPPHKTQVLFYHQFD